MLITSSNIFSTSPVWEKINAIKISKGRSRNIKYQGLFFSIDSINNSLVFIQIPFAILERISNRIVNEVVSVNRVVYDITSKPPGTIEWEWKVGYKPCHSLEKLVSNEFHTRIF